MLHRPFARAVVSSFLLLGGLAAAHAQSIVIEGVADRANYRDSATFRVVTNAGFTYQATLNGIPVAVGVSNTVMIMDYYDLVVRRTQTSGGAIANALVRFIVESSRRLKVGDSSSPENGLIEWIPLPPIPSTAAEMAGATLQVVTPQDYPAGLEIPVVARVEDAIGNERRVNGWVSAAGFESSAFRILRGVGHGFLPPATAGTVSYTAQLQSLQTNKQIQIEASTTWTTVSGVLGTTTVWPPHSRIHVTGNLTIPAAGTLTIGEGTVVRLNPNVNLTNSGRTVINGTTTEPVVFTPTNRVAPEQKSGAWGGWIMRGTAAQLIANSAIMTGSGAASGFSFTPGTSHKSDQPLLLVHSGATVRMTNCALINQGGQIGNGYFSSIVWDHCTIQRAVTVGEYEGCTNIIFHSALIEFPAVDGVYNATISDADYDGYYTIRGTNYLAHSLFGFAKDDAIDSGSGTGATGSVRVVNCWIESALHEALAWSGDGRQTWTYDSVLINCGQGLECGWSGPGGNSPLVYGGHILSLANSVGSRYGDNYPGTSGLGFKDGFLTLTNSIVLHNYRDVWGQVWDNTWNYRVADMDVHDNYLTAPNTNHPNNTVWNPTVDAAKLAAFMSTPPDAPVGIGLALWPNQLVPAILTNGLPVRLSSFTTNAVSVDYAVSTPNGTLAAGTLVFTPGETVKKITLTPATVLGSDAIQVLLRNPSGGEITGDAKAYLVNAPSGATSPNITFIPYGSSWKYLDDGSNQGTAWRNPGFNDTGWSNGVAELGYGDGDETTMIRSNRMDNTRIATTYFRKTIDVGDATRFGSFNLLLRRDDAGVVYFNGTDVFRSPNLPAGNLAFDFVTGGTAPPDNTVDTTNIINTANVLSNGINLVACEIHQQALGSSDVSFDLQLVGVAATVARLYLANFGTELVIYWSDPTMRLESNTNLPGNWVAVPNAGSPYVVAPAAAQQFFRLRR